MQSYINTCTCTSAEIHSLDRWNIKRIKSIIFYGNARVKGDYR